MSGLYHRALEIYRQTVGLRLVGKGEAGLDMEDVSPEDRDKILRQINEVIDRNRLKVQPDTFAITAKRRGIGLPILINGTIAAVVIAVILIFSILFNRQEDVLATGTGTILSTESKLIETLRKESEEQLQQKDREIRAAQDRLQETMEEQRRLQAETQTTLRQREEQLEAEFQKALAEERQRLLDQGLSEAAIAERLRTFEIEKRAELEAEFAGFRRQTEEAAAAKEAALAGLVQDFERNLQAAQAERSQLESQLQQRETELRQQFEAQAEALESDRARVAEQLSALQEQQRQEQLVLDQILGVYKTVNELIAEGEYTPALEQLASIRSYLDQEPARSLAGIQRRRPVELFVISALEDLIRSRSSEQQRDIDSLIDAASRVTALQEGIDKGDRLFEGGDTGAARTQYLAALAEIPAAKAGQEKLAEIEARRQSRIRRNVVSTLSQGRSLYESEQYRESLERYREALNLLLEDPAAVDRLVDQIAAISAFLSPAAAVASATADAAIQPESAAELDDATAARIAAYQDQIAELERENNRLSQSLSDLQEQERSLQTANNRLSEELERLQAKEQSLAAENARLVEQQTLLQGDQTEVAAKLDSLQREKADLAAQAELLREERDKLSVQQESLSAQVGQLQAEKDSLSTRAETLSAQNEQLLSDRDSLSARNKQLQSEVAGLIAGRDALQLEKDKLTAERDRLAAELSEAETPDIRRERLQERLDGLQARFESQRRSADLSADTSPQELAKLLEAKLLTWQIISSDPVASEYPELYDTMDNYLESLMEQSVLDGRYRALEDMITVVDALLDTSAAATSAEAVSADLWRRYSYTDRQDLMTRLLDRLERVIK